MADRRIKYILDMIKKIYRLDRRKRFTKELDDIVKSHIFKLPIYELKTVITRLEYMVKIVSHADYELIAIVDY